MKYYYTIEKTNYKGVNAIAVCSVLFEDDTYDNIAVFYDINDALSYINIVNKYDNKGA